MIPLTKDVANLVGEWADHVDNRSLLHEKYALPKVWGKGNDDKCDDAGRWNVLRIVTGGQKLLERDAARLTHEAQGRNVGDNMRARKMRNAEIAKRMAAFASADERLVNVCNENGRRLLNDLSKSYDEYVIILEATLGSRMMINVAGGVVQNAGIALDRCFGQPFIPGSAVKGITRVQALWEIHEAKNDQKLYLLKLAMLLFGYGKLDLNNNGDFGWAGGSDEVKRIAQEIGSIELKGCASFLPAYPTSKPTLVVDMINPHYPEYYQGVRPTATDDESPIPNYFPAVEAGSSFGFAALINRDVLPFCITADAILDQLKKWLEGAVTHKGVGAKTAAGYGWFALGRTGSVGSESNSTTTTVIIHGSLSESLITKWKGRLDSTTNLRAVVSEMICLNDDADLLRVFNEIIPEGERRNLQRNSPYWQSFTSGETGAEGLKILSRLGINLT